MSKNLIIKILFILGIIFLFFLFAFIVIKLAPRVFTGIANVSQTVISPFKKDSISLESSDKEVASGQKFFLSWNYRGEQDGYYALSYSCTENLNLQILSGNSFKNLLCNVQNNLENTEKAELVANLNKKNTIAELPIKIEYVDKFNKNIIASREITVSIKNESGFNSNNNTTISAEPVINQNNSNISTNPGTDLVFIDMNAIDSDTIIFTIANNGRDPSGTWYFDYTDTNNKKLSSPLQLSLSSGQMIRYTLNLENQKNGSVNIVIDPKNNISETNENNNSRSVSLSGNDNDNSYNSNDDADLEIIDMKVGYMSGSKFREDDEIDENDEAAVLFVVKNNGGKSTGSFRFEIENLPYDNDDSYRSDKQSSLNPGQTKEIIVSFDNPDEGRYNINVVLDSDKDVREESERNNEESETLRVRN